MIDSHAHLDDIHDLEPALKRARQAGVEAVIAVGVNLESDKKVLKIRDGFKEKGLYPAIYPALGFHPGDIDTFTSDEVFSFIRKEAGGIAAIGEIGLDFWYKEARKDGPARRLQEEIFLKQLEISREYGKPVIIHSRGAWKECCEMAISHKIKRAVFHWYSGPEDVLREVLANGYFISATPAAEYSPEHRRAIEIAPLSNLFLETDCPVAYKRETGKYRSEPRDVLRVLKAVAQIKDIEETEVARQTTENVIGWLSGPME